MSGVGQALAKAAREYRVVVASGQQRRARSSRRAGRLPAVFSPPTPVAAAGGVQTGHTRAGRPGTATPTGCGSPRRRS